MDDRDSQILDADVSETSDTTGSHPQAGTVPDRSLTTAQAAELAGVSPRTIRRWIEKGALPATSGTGGVFYVFAHDVEQAKKDSQSRTARTGPGRPVVEDNNIDPDGPDVTRTSPMSPDPAGDAAGAILTAWRDTVLAPVVEELSLTRRELGDVRQALGRAEAEREQALREQRALEDRIATLEAEAVAADAATSEAPGPSHPVPDPSALSAPAPVDLRPRWKRLLGLP